MICFDCEESKCSGACGDSVSLRDITDYKTYTLINEKKNEILGRYMELSCNFEFNHLRNKLLDKSVFKKINHAQDLDDLEQALKDFEELNSMLETQLL